MIRAAARAFHCARNTVRKWPHRSPDQLRAQRAPHNDPRIFFLPPVVLSSLTALDLPETQRSGAGT